MAPPYLVPHLIIRVHCGREIDLYNSYSLGLTLFGLGLEKLSRRLENTAGFLNNMTRMKKPKYPIFVVINGHHGEGASQ